MWTKSISAGALLVASIALLFGRMSYSVLASVAAPVLALLFLGITLFLLVVDLEHPWKFYTILTRPQWRSWLVRGAVILTAFGAVSALWFAPLLVGDSLAPLDAHWWMAWAAIPTAAAAAGYTAYLLAQATGRELWATPLAAPHLVVQAALAGAGVLLMVATALPLENTIGVKQDIGFLRVVFLVSLFTHAAFVVAELFTPHRSTHVARATATIVRGRYAREFWGGAVVVGIVLAAIVALVSAAPLPLALAAALALVGLYAWEYVWVFGGQSVPLS
jgi:formate-dependent nitrite reductase membrane component NrfD